MPAITMQSPLTECAMRMFIFSIKAQRHTTNEHDMMFNWNGPWFAGDITDDARISPIKELKLATMLEF